MVRRLSLAILLPWMTTRLLLYVVAILAHHYYPSQTPASIQGYPWLSCWLHWDAYHYTNILQKGYLGPDNPSLAFFPLFPYLSSIFYVPLKWGLPTDLSAALALWLTSNILFPIGLAGLYYWLRTCSDEATAQRGCWLLCLAPFSFFSCSLYTESLFLALTCWSLYFHRQKHLLPAYLLAGLAAITRPQGIFFAFSLGLYWLFKGPRRLPSLTLLCLPLLLFLGCNWYHWGHPLAFIKAQSTWGGPLAPRGELLHFRLNYSTADITPFATMSANFIALLLAIAVIPLIYWRAGFSVALFTLLSVFIPGCRYLVSMARFTTFLAPLYLAWGRVLRGPTFLLIATLSTLLQCYFCWQFAAEHWVV